LPSSLFGAAEGDLLTFLVNSSRTHYCYEIHRLLFCPSASPYDVLDRYCGQAKAAIALKGMDIMDIQTLLHIIIVVLLLGGGGWYGRGRWF
jgi:hypothetical protein